VERTFPTAGAEKAKAGNKAKAVAIRKMSLLESIRALLLYNKKYPFFSKRVIVFFKG
jgi:hypothetical protein